MFTIYFEKRQLCLRFVVFNQYSASVPKAPKNASRSLIIVINNSVLAENPLAHKGY